MNRRDMLKLSSLAAAAASTPAVAAAGSAESPATKSGPVPRWDHLEINLPGLASGNPFIDVTLTATFRNQKRGISVEYMVKQNEGHGFHNQENQFDFYSAMEKFLDQHLSQPAQNTASR